MKRELEIWEKALRYHYALGYLNQPPSACNAEVPHLPLVAFEGRSGGLFGYAYRVNARGAVSFREVEAGAITHARIERAQNAARRITARVQSAKGSAPTPTPAEAKALLAVGLTARELPYLAGFEGAGVAA